MKKMMLIGYTDKVGIKAVAPMRVPSYHVAERTPHPLKWTPKSPPSATVVDDFIIDDLDPNKSMGGQLSLVYSTITTLATSAVTQERQYVKAIADLKAGQPVESKPVGEDAHRRYTAALARVGDGRTVAGRSRAAEAARDGHGDALVAFQAGDAVGPSAATQAAGADYQGAVAAYRAGNPVGPSPGPRRPGPTTTPPCSRSRGGTLSGPRQPPKPATPISRLATIPARSADPDRPRDPAGGVRRGTTEVAAVVLAGGAARRMGGVDKVMLHLAGATLLDRVLAAAASVASRLVVVGPRRPTAVERVAFVQEPEPRGGPVPAVAAALKGVREPVVLVLAGDLPLIRAADLAHLLAAIGDHAAAAALDDRGAPNPLVAAYRTSWLHARDAGAGSAAARLLPRDPVLVALPPEATLNVNTPEDLERAQAWLSADPVRPGVDVHRAAPEEPDQGHP